MPAPVRSPLTVIFLTALFGGFGSLEALLATPLCAGYSLLRVFNLQVCQPNALRRGVDLERNHGSARATRVAAAGCHWREHRSRLTLSAWITCEKSHSPRSPRSSLRSLATLAHARHLHNHSGGTIRPNDRSCMRLPPKSRGPVHVPRHRKQRAATAATALRGNGADEAT